MNCERCGKDIPDSAAICPNCGTITNSSWSAPQPQAQPPTQHGQYGNTQASPGSQGYQQGYMQQPSPQPQPGYGYGPSAYNPPPQYSQQGGVNVVVVNGPGYNAPVSTKNTGALTAEIILSIFGIFGVGWLMAGETTTGVILLICSLVVYLPIIVTLSIFTVGICSTPLVIAAIVINAILLNKLLNAKAQQMVMVQSMPPQYPPRPQY